MTFEKLSFELILILVGSPLLTFLFYTLFPIPYSLSPTPYSLFPIPYSLCFAEEQKKIAARVNGAPITEAEVERAIDAYIPRSVYHGTVRPEKRQEYRGPALDMLIERELIYQEAKARGLTVKEREIDTIVKETKKRIKDNKGDFEKALKAEGLTLEGYREILRKDELIKKVLKVEVEDKAKYPDGELEGYYNANKGKFIRPEGFRVKHILLTVSPDAADKEKTEKKEKAMDVLKKAAAGEDFSELASKYSEDAYRVKGGDLGWIHKGRLLIELEEAALKLQVGEIRGLIETAEGYHIIKLEEKKPAEQLSFSDVKDSLRKELETKRHKELKEALIKALKEKAKIEIY